MRDTHPPVNITSVLPVRHGRNSSAAGLTLPVLDFPAMATVTEQIREYLKARGDSVRRIHLQTGLNRATVADFLNGRDVRGQTLDALCDYLGATVTLPPLPKEPKRK